MKINLSILEAFGHVIEFFDEDPSQHLFQLSATKEKSDSEIINYI